MSARLPKLLKEDERLAGLPQRALRILRYKAEWVGRSWHVHGRFQRSTGVCPDCSRIGAKLTLCVRKCAYAGCGVVHDRDVAAARVILGGARVAEAIPVGQALPEPAGAIQRKRSSVVCGGVRASARASHGEPLPNVVKGAPRDWKQ
jgi:transposase